MGINRNKYVSISSGLALGFGLGLQPAPDTGGGVVPTTKILLGTFGQSNDSGRGTGNRPYVNYGAGWQMFGNDYVLKAVADPTDSNVGQLDAVSSDSAAAGSIWPYVLSRFSQVHGGIPGELVLASKGGTVIADRLPGADRLDRSTQYGSLVYRLKQRGAGTAGVLTIVELIQGESDAQAGTTEAAYVSAAETIRDALRQDIGPSVIVMFSKFPFCTEAAANAGQATIWSAIDTIWTKPNMTRGADLSVIRVDDNDGLHINSALLQSVAADKVTLPLQSAAGYTPSLMPSTNLVSKSEALDQWTATRVTVTANALANPIDGAITADLVTASATTGSKALASPTFTVTTGDNPTCSIYLYAGTARYIQLFGSSAQFGTDRVNFDLQTGEYAKFGVFAGYIEAVPNHAGWFRAEFSAPMLAVGGAQFTLAIVSSLTAVRAEAGTAANGLTFYAFGGQGELRPSAGPYVATA